MAEEEDENIARLRDWWRSNGLALVLGIVAGLAAIGGWQGWQAYSDSRAESAAAAYDELEQVLGQDDAEPDAVIAAAEQIQSDYGGSPYAAQAGLAVADFLVQRQSYQRATEHLQWVIDYAEQLPMRHLARVRKARLLWAQDKPEEALALLDASYPRAFTPLYSELAGDIHAGTGDRAQAQTAYREALDTLPPDADRGPLQRKLEAVADTDGNGTDGQEVS